MTSLFLLFSVYLLLLLFVAKKPGIALVFVLLFATINNIILDTLALAQFRYMFGLLIIMVYLILYFRLKTFEYSLGKSKGNGIFLGVLLLLLGMFINIHFVGGVTGRGLALANTFLLPIMVFFLFSAFIIYKPAILEQMSLGLIIFGAVFFVVFYLLVDVGTIDIGSRITIEETGRFNAITLARICGLIAIPGVLYSIYSSNKLLKAVSISITILSLYWLFATATRGVILAVFLSLSAYFTIFTPGNKKKYLIWSVLAIVLVLIWIGTITLEKFAVIDRFTQLQTDYDTMPRWHDYPRAWNIFKDNILLGVGPGGYTVLTGRGYPHNLFLELIAEYGLFGVFAFLLIVISGTYNSVKILKKRAFDYKVNVFILLWFYFLVASMFSGNISMNRDFWVVSGILISVIRLERIKTTTG